MGKAGTGTGADGNEGVDAAQVEALRRFNRFYTRWVGALDEGHLDSPYSLVEIRLLYEIATATTLSASDLVRNLDLDAGYLSRVIRSLEQRGLVMRTVSAVDGRRQTLGLTLEGELVYTDLLIRTRASIAAQLRRLDDTSRITLVESMARVRSLLGGDLAAETGSGLVIRGLRPGDLGWVLMHQTEQYERERGWGAPFEALVSQVLADFARTAQPATDRAWIAELDGERVGSIFLVRHPDREGVCKLRLLLVDPKARGIGLGKRLVRECLQFAREAGYRRITLWTNAGLDTARHIYVSEGFQLVAEEVHTLFGAPLTGQTWELDL